ncbi:MAG: hypothetical protein HY646_05230, partial [Acidobacteria bacterium]|nr:hypothetical protein [Acidobacteriota bacterium]
MRKITLFAFLSFMGLRLVPHGSGFRAQQRVEPKPVDAAYSLESRAAIGAHHANTPVPAGADGLASALDWGMEQKEH